MTWTPTHPQLDEVFKKHLRYEIVRLVEMYLLLQEPAPYRKTIPSATAATVHDGLLVGFCSHGRNLLEFFFRDQHTKFYYALATDYADARYVRLDKNRADVKRLYEQICAQINHLGYDRTNDDTKKVQGPECAALVKLVHDEVERLARHLKSGYDKVHLALDQLAAVAMPSVAMGAIEPSNEIQIVTSTSPSPPSAPVKIAGTTSW
ncbi:MAG TPA: hypothetical protein VJ454_16855 [Steroidobacteraceae bacterium]|jgi:hypothetical protein|nr:hypothetical protein [Steroidobacteraceae bacterium]